MKKQLKLGAFLLLSASLFYGFAARAQGIMQSENVSYALTLIDAGENGTNDTRTGGPVTQSTKKVRVKVTVSVPRSEGSNAYGAITVNANPARLMFRKHSAESTAFDGTLSLTRDAPYGTTGSPLTTAYYPMPQVDANKTPIIDARELNLAAVRTGQSTNVNGKALEDYVGFGQAHDLGRWEATYLSPAFSVDDILAANDDSPANLLMLKSLLMGESTYEWFAASRRGLGSVARISDIEDYGRKMDFDDLRLWVPDTDVESPLIDLSSQFNLGKYDQWKLFAMPGVADDAQKWSIHYGTIGTNDVGVGAQLLNHVGADIANLSDFARIESPIYPNGVSVITFDAGSAAQDVEGAEGEGESLLRVDYCTDMTQGKWTELTTLSLTSKLRTYTVAFQDKLPSGSEARFRLVRMSTSVTTGAAYLTTYTISNLVVRSADPVASFDKLKVQIEGYTGERIPNANESFTVSLNATAGAGKVPRGYKGEIQLRRRAHDDNTRVWYTIPAEVTYDASTGNGSLSAKFTPGALLMNPDGSLNVKENAFFVGANGHLTGLLPGVYDVRVQCDILGSFEAGRNEIDGYESVSVMLDGYDREEDDENGLPVTVHYPYILNVRERATAANTVFMRVTYRTGSSAANYDIDYIDVPLLPSAKADNTWRVDLEKVLKHAESTAVYAWGYESIDETTQEEKIAYEVGYISFKLCAVDAVGNATWYGQNLSGVAASVFPTPVEVVPAVAETLTKATSEETAVPVVVAVDSLPNSHLMVELNLTEADAPIANMAGSFWQDFNNWDPSEVFAETEYRENVTSAIADFDCELGVIDGETGVFSGWIPDEGPLAETTSFFDEVATGRIGQEGQFPFILPATTVLSKDLFASWGASNRFANPKLMRYDGSSSNASDYLTFSDGTEVVLRRGYHSFSGNIYRPDSLFRLQGAGATLTPRTDSNVSIKLKGVGKVGFKLSMSLPYDLNKVAEFITSDENADQYYCLGKGLSASVSFSSPSQTCAPSGYSVSYYLIDARANARYELRVTQMTVFDDEDKSRAPTNQTVMELYKWSNGSCERQALLNPSGGELQNPWVSMMSDSLANCTYGLWVMPDGHIALGYRAGLNDALNIVAKSKEVLVTHTRSFSLALGSAECRPQFRYIDRLETASTNYVGTSISPDLYTITVADYASGRGVWDVGVDPDNSGRIMLKRMTPQAITEGKVIVRVRKGTDVVSEKEFSTDKMDVQCDVIVGVANATMEILPFKSDDGTAFSNVFIDDITVTSWCGNDENRNGDSRVPDFTDQGFNERYGFAGVGLWIRPESDDQLGVSPANYNGRQCLLMQRSRQNNEKDFKERETDGVKHTAGALALYFPYTNGMGYGPVSFRYRIPQYDEFGSMQKLSSVRVMLQYITTGPHTDFLNNAPGEANWINVSDPVELRNTAGEWSMATIKPKLDGKELVGVKGTMRLVMVITDQTTDNAYVYLDDVRVTSNETGTSASWTATNVRVTTNPINKLYWKDRLATNDASPAEDVFAPLDSDIPLEFRDNFKLKSSLTRAMEFNNTTGASSSEEDKETEGTYPTTVLESPILEEGVGRVVFAARLAEPQPNPVRLYICATSDTSDKMEGLEPVTYVEVSNTVYTTFDIDLSKYRHYKTVPNEDGSPSDNYTGGDFACSTVRRLTIKAFVDGDSIQNDGFGGTPVHGRVLIDQLSISNPVLPSIRVASVAFSNQPGSDVPAEFDARSPLSQPVKGASILRTMVRLDRAQLLKDESIRVFLTVDPQSLENSSLKRYDMAYSYEDVLGGSVSADSTHPIYSWDQNNLEKWPLSAWFDSAAAFESISQALNQQAPLSVTELETLGLKNTIELKREDAKSLCFYGNLSESLSSLGLTALPENSLVRYNAWAVYQSEDSDQWFYTQIKPAAYTEFPWYFPRSLNAELREKASTDTDVKDNSFFSPYYWVYSYLPGEAFINEFNFNDHSDAVNNSLRHFVEICAPSNTNLGGWRIEMTDSNSASSISESSISIAPGDGKVMEDPELGVVPYQRKTATSALRSFYTAFSSDAEVFYRDENYEETGERNTTLKTTKNGGVAERSIDGWWTLGSGYQASSVRLHRPTGGAEHIVCFALNGEQNIKNERTKQYLESLYNKYQAAYAEMGFGGEWQQTFTTGSWADYTRDTNDGFGAADKITAEEHARRLVMAYAYPADEAKENRFALDATGTGYVNDVANSGYANSIATVDMGGVFVTRKNAINNDADNGPLDLTDVMVGKWDPNNNPTVKTRIVEPEGGTDGLAPVVQVTPCQINPDQYMVLYAGFSSSVVTSELTEGLGTHSLEMIDAQDVSLYTSAAGRETPYTWGLTLDVEKVKLTYTALPFHQVNQVTFRLKDASDPSKFITDKAVLEQVVSVTNGEADYTTSTDGWFTVNVGQDAAKVELLVSCTSPVDSELRYSLDATASFKLDPTGGDARKVITMVRPYCGAGSAEYPVPGSAKYQPWWGSNFGFEVAYDEAALVDGVVLSSLIVTYPSPTVLAKSEWKGVLSSWTGWSHTYQKTDANGTTDVTAGLEGMEYADALTFLKEQLIPNADVGTRYVEMTGGANGFFVDASLISILGDTYAREMGYDPTKEETANTKEPAIPFCVWGVYTATVPSAHGTEKISFLMRQATPGENAAVWSQPAHYAPLEDLNNGKSPVETLPYFYLYSTPPQSAWVNEVNAVSGTAEDPAPFVEVVFPTLRDGILQNHVPQADPAGWLVQCYNANGSAGAQYSLTTGEETSAGSTSYKYLTCSMQNDTTRDTMAYVLHRPCGAAEGGVWVGKADQVGTDTTIPAVTNNQWLVPEDVSLIFADESEVISVAGSVQLVGKTVLRDGFNRLSSAAADRSEWNFAPATAGTKNDGDLLPDTKPVWNQVTVTSTLRNTVYTGTSAGYQLIPGLFDQPNLMGETDPVTLTMGGGDWVYNMTETGLVLSYRPRASYRFETMTLPAELIGKVILVGRRGTLSATTILEQVRTLTDKAALDPSVKLTEWLTLGGRAEVEMRTVVDATGSREEPTGKIIFDTEHFEGNDDKGKPITFGDYDDYVISLVFIGEPASAQNTIEVSFGQGEVKLGAWMVTQTLFGLDETGAPDPEKGGAVVTDPIWSDEEGTATGNYTNLHGWLYQPITGDTIAMTTVINPELGLQGAKVPNPVGSLTAQTATLRPFLVWTAIPKDRVPDNLFTGGQSESGMARPDFIKGWGLSNWIGGTPSIQDGSTLKLDDLRKRLAEGAVSTATTALYAKAGIIPMVYKGYCDENKALNLTYSLDTIENRPAETLLSFSTMTETELADALANPDGAGLSNANDTLLPYTATIDMTDASFWKDGAILRFAVIIADPVTGYVYDCQSISNFSSDAQPAYCPWYIPDATTNINTVTSSADEGGGVSPFAWIYNIPQGGVWLNELRPFAVALDSGLRVASAVELAMKASPIKEDVTDPATTTFTPTRTLDGWKIVTRYAPMPALNGDPSEPINWVTHKEVPLKSWVPRRRIVRAQADEMATGGDALYQNADFSLDFYAAVAAPSVDKSVDLGLTLTKISNAYTRSAYDGTTEDEPFQWYNFNLKNDLTGSDYDFFNAGIQEKLMTEEAAIYGEGIIYSMILVRNNGAVEDEVLFYHTSPYDANSSEWLDKRLALAVEREEANNTCASTVRVITATSLSAETVSAKTVQFLDFSSAGGTTRNWWIMDEGFTSTLSSPNAGEGTAGVYAYSQPNMEQVFSYDAFANIEAALTGGNGVTTLKLDSIGEPQIGKTVFQTLLVNTSYTLSLKDWNTDWYKLETTKDGEVFTPTFATIYQITGATASEVKTIVIDTANIQKSVSYNLVLTYTDAAKQLEATGALNSEDPDFLAWVTAVKPGEISTTGLTAAEKFWLGAEHAAEDIDVKLGFTNVGLFSENNTEKPFVSVLLEKDATRITEIKGDGNIVLLGKKTLQDAEWTYLQTLESDDLKENAEIILSTDCKFFRAVLISDKNLQEMTTAP